MVLYTMNNEEKVFEAVRTVPVINVLLDKVKHEVTDKFRRATKYPYILRYDLTDDRMNNWRVLCILPSKAVKKKHIYQTLCYTTYEVPPMRKENNTNSGRGALLYDPLAMAHYIENRDDPNVRLAAVMDIVPHAVNRFTDRCLKAEGKTGLDIHKKMESLILRWRHFDVLPDQHGDLSSIKHKDDGLLPYDIIMGEGGLLRGQLVNNLLVRMFTYVSKDDLFENQEERHAEMLRERMEWKAKGWIP